MTTRKITITVLVLLLLLALALLVGPCVLTSNPVEPRPDPATTDTDGTSGEPSADGTTGAT